jgi:hypothetical protein
VDWWIPALSAWAVLSLIGAVILALVIRERDRHDR